jgi:hypothetical protein
LDALAKLQEQGGFPMAAEEPVGFGMNPKSKRRPPMVARFLAHADKHTHTHHSLSLQPNSTRYFTAYGERAQHTHFTQTRPRYAHIPRVSVTRACVVLALTTYGT